MYYPIFNMVVITVATYLPLDKTDKNVRSYSTVPAVADESRRRHTPTYEIVRWEALAKAVRHPWL